jgi:mono/diheme cytochrome c family protein
MILRNHLRGLSTPASRVLILALLAASGLLLSGCAEMGTLVDQPYYRPLDASELFPDGRSARPFQPGTVPYAPGDESPNDPALTGLDEAGQPVEGFPVDVDQDLIARGQERYTIYCTPCHGPDGSGNGRVTGFGFPVPPSLLEENSRGLTNAEIFEIITNGQGNMFPYGYRVKPDERWAVIAYVRALQLRNGAVEAQDLTQDDVNQIGNQP